MKLVIKGSPDILAKWLKLSDDMKRLANPIAQDSQTLEPSAIDNWMVDAARAVSELKGLVLETHVHVGQNHTFKDD